MHSCNAELTNRVLGRRSTTQNNIQHCVRCRIVRGWCSNHPDCLFFVGAVSFKTCVLPLWMILKPSLSLSTIGKSFSQRYWQGLNIYKGHENCNNGGKFGEK